MHELGDRMKLMHGRTFRVVLIKPSHYDDEGYVIQWWRSTIPSNSLATVYALIEECAADQVLGSDVSIEIEAYDEGKVVIDVNRAIRRIRRAGAGFVGLVGVHSNQFPRALDLDAILFAGEAEGRMADPARLSYTDDALRVDQGAAEPPSFVRARTDQLSPVQRAAAAG